MGGTLKKEGMLLNNELGTPKMEFYLETLRNRIPNFDERCRNFYKAWKFKTDQRLVRRMGFVKMRFYKNRDVKELFYPEDREIDDAVHVLGMIDAIILFKDFFGSYISLMYGYQPQWLEHVEEALFHEVGEIGIGDWTDDGSYDTEEKDRLEQTVFDDFMAFFPEEAQERHQKQFARVRDNRTVVKLFDKEAFILGIGYLKSKCIVGTMRSKIGITERDREFCKKTGSERPIDNVFAGLLNHYKGSPLLPFFVGITEAIYAEDFKEIDSSVKDCVAGAPPPGVKQFYDY